MITRADILAYAKENYDTDPEQTGFAPAYHMNKKHWLTILLNGSIDDDEIYNLLDMSYEMTKGKKVL